MMVKKIISLLLLLLAVPTTMAVATLRGGGTGHEEEEEDEQFLRKLGGNKGGNRRCPRPAEDVSIQCSVPDDCTTNAACAGREGCCCVAAAIPYCGVPSDCNRYLQCVGAPDPNNGGTGSGPQGGSGSGTTTGGSSSSGGSSHTAKCVLCTDPQSNLIGFELFRINDGVCTEECFDGLRIQAAQDEGWRCGLCSGDQV